MKPDGVAIIGGGRWARVLAGVCLHVLPPETTLYLCSPSNENVWKSWLAGNPDIGGRKVRILTELETVLSHPTLTHVLIARSARDHSTTVTQALAAGKNVFVEKPFATSLPAAKSLATLAAAARARNLVCTTGLVFCYAENLNRFANCVAGRSSPTSLRLAWTDPIIENRHGEAKRFDTSLNIVWDVFPHAWSVMRHVVGDAKMVPIGVAPLNGGATLKIELTCGPCNIDVLLARNATERSRKMWVSGADWRAEIDFTQEPGTASVDDQVIDVSRGFQSPLATQLGAFLGQSARLDPRCDLSQSLEPLMIADWCGAAIQRSQLEIISNCVSDPSFTDLPVDAAYALTEILGSSGNRDGINLDHLLGRLRRLHVAGELTGGICDLEQLLGLLPQVTSPKLR